ncbi:MAG TPA: sulfotransferase [Thermoanaerobaculia bacterium]
MSGHLIHIGYPKTATNFLRSWFAQHPQLEYVEGGIGGFRDVYDVVRTSASRRSRALYRVTSSEGLATPLADFGAGAISYDRSAGLSLADAQRTACDTLADLFPNAKILIVTRGFRSAIPSMYSQTVRTGTDSDFEAFCRMLESAVREGIDGWDFCRVVGLYRERFGNDNVIVMPYELLQDDVRAFTSALESRLGLDAFAPAQQRLNPSLTPAELYWYPRFSRVIRKFGSKRVLQIFGRSVQQNRLRAPVAVLQRLRPAASQSTADIPESLVEAYRGRADCLRDEPPYARYAREYLF